MTADQNTATSERAHGSQPLLYQHGPIIQEYGTLRLLPIALAPRCAPAELPAAQPDPGRHDDPLQPVQEAPLADARARPSTNCTCCSTSTPASNSSWSTRWPSGSRCSAGWRSPTRATSAEMTTSSARRTASRRCRRCSRGCSRRTRRSSTAVRAAIEQTDAATATAAPTTC